MDLPRNEYRISIISSCNMKCIYCHNEGNLNKGIMTLNQIEGIIQRSDNLGLKKIRITGGEPLLHPEIIDICKTLSEKYKLEVGINTNGIEKEKILFLIKSGWVKRVIVGLDYFDAKISKKSSIGHDSKTIKKNILDFKNAGADVSISTVYDENLSDVINIVNWCICNLIRVKIIEVISEINGDSTGDDYLKMSELIVEKYNLKTKVDDFGELQGYLNEFNIVSFFHSLCRLKKCDICKKIHLRITCDGKMKYCIHKEAEFDAFSGKLENKVKELLL